MNPKINKKKTLFTFGVSISAIPVLVFFLLLGASTVLSAPLKKLLPNYEEELILEDALFSSTTLLQEQIDYFSNTAIEDALSFNDTTLPVLQSHISQSFTTQDDFLPSAIQGVFYGNILSEGISVLQDMYTDLASLNVVDGTYSYSTGSIILPFGNTQAEVLFSESYIEPPLVTIIGDDGHEFIVTGISTEGFTLSAFSAETDTRTIQWAAKGKKIRMITVIDTGEVESIVRVAIDTEQPQPIIDSGDLSLPFDAEPPHILINGDNPAQIKLGGTYTDAGAYATDNVTDDIIGVQASLNDVVVESYEDIFIDTSILAVHTIEYSATDQSGNIGSAYRIVIVGYE